MPEGIEKFYVEKHFPENVKLVVKDMLDNIENSMVKRIQNLEWLDDSTREYAIEKVMKLDNMIGYEPDNVEKSYIEIYVPIPLNNSFLSIKKNLLKNNYRKETFKEFLYDGSYEKLEKRLIQKRFFDSKSRASYVSIYNE